MGNLNIVQKAFEKIMEERIAEVAWEQAKLDNNYVEADNKRYLIFDLLEESLTTDRQKHLLSELEGIWNFAELLMQGYAYRQGLKDSQMIHKELKKFGIDVTKESIGSTL